MIASRRRKQQAARVGRCAIGHVPSTRWRPEPGAAEIAGCGRRGAGGCVSAWRQASRGRAEPGKLRSMLLLLELDVADLALSQASALGLAQLDPGLPRSVAGAS